MPWLNPFTLEVEYSKQDLALMQVNSNKSLKSSIESLQLKIVTLEEDIAKIKKLLLERNKE